MWVLDQASQTCQKRFLWRKVLSKKATLLHMRWHYMIWQTHLELCFDTSDISSNPFGLFPILIWNWFVVSPINIHPQSHGAIMQKHLLPLESIFCRHPGHKGSFKSACFHILQLVQFSQEVQIHLEKIRFWLNVNLQTWLSSSVISLHCPLKESTTTWDLC